MPLPPRTDGTTYGVLAAVVYLALNFVGPFQPTPPYRAAFYKTGHSLAVEVSFPERHGHVNSRFFRYEWGI